MGKAVVNKTAAPIRADQMSPGDHGIVINHTQYKDRVLVMTDQRLLICVSTGISWGEKCSLDVIKLITKDVITITV